MDDRAGIGAPEPLQRTDAQEEGVPAPEVAASQPEQSAAEPMKVSTILSRITEAAAASAEALTPLHHEEHTTPPPSPFALHAAQVCVTSFWGCGHVVTSSALLYRLAISNDLLLGSLIAILLWSSAMEDLLLKGQWKMERRLSCTGPFHTSTSL